MTLSPDVFRDVMGRLAGGVTVVTARDGEGVPRGFTATAVCSVSLSPPLVLVCVANGSQTLSAIRDTGSYALNFLSSDGARHSDRFAVSGEGKFDSVDWVPAPSGSPLLAGAVAWVECETQRAVEAGDHTIFIGRVVDGRVERAEVGPLVHYGSAYHVLERADP